MACLVAVLFAQASEPPAERKAEARADLHFRLIEYFDDPREPSHFRHPYTLQVPTASGVFTYNSECRWRPWRPGHGSAFPFPPVLEDQEEEPLREFPLRRPAAALRFKSATLGPSLTFPGELGIPEVSGTSRQDPVTVAFDEVDAGVAPGGRLGVTLAIGALFDVDLFAGVLAGDVEAGTSETRLVPDGLGGFMREETPFDLEGRCTLLEFGVAPRVLSLEVVPELLSLSLAPVAGGYIGRLEDLSIERGGVLSESIPLGDESLSGFFAGALVRASLRVGSSLRVELGGDYVRILGDVEGGPFSLFATLALDF